MNKKRNKWNGKIYFLNFINLIFLGRFVNVLQKRSPLYWDAQFKNKNNKYSVAKVIVIHLDDHLKLILKND